MSSTTRVLIADASRQIRDFLRDAVTGHGDHAEIIEAVNGVEAIDILNERDVELAFVDVEMPGLAKGNAIDRTHFYRKKSFLVLLCADEGTADSHNDLANLALTKPIHRNAILTAIRNWKIWRETYSVLLATPDPRWREEMREELRKLDLNLIVTEEVDGAEALLRCRQTHVDIVFADRGLPTMGSEEVLQMIRRQRLPVKVILTGPDGSTESVARAKKLRADGYAYRGIPLEEMSRTVLRTLGVKAIENMK
ncbi:MAG: response regulator [Alphaproteobacteria bacterium]|nr:response regulator [Alphaproteobacteria bacterium]